MAFLRAERPPTGALTILDPNKSAAARRITHPAPSKSLVAAGVKVNRQMSSTYQRLIQPWQIRSFAYYDSIGEVNYAAQFYSRMLSELRMFPGIIQDDGTVEEDTDPDAQAALARIQDPGGGTTGLLAAYGRLMFLVGEAILFVSTDHDTELEQWEMLSQQEIRLYGGSYQRMRAPSFGFEEYRPPDNPDEEEEAWVPVGDAEKNEAVAYRLWQRHPLYSSLADSTMKGILSICEELLLLEQSLRARLRSRVAGAGFLIIDERVTATPAETQPDEDPEEDPVLAAIVNAMLAPIADEGTASAVVPLVLRVSTGENAKVQDMIHHLQVVDPMQMYPETGLRLECIRRMAISLDMPAEYLEGLGDVNHWTAWSIDEQTWKQHGQQKAQQLVDDLTSAYYRPYLRDVLQKPDWDKRCVAYDASKIINHPDRSKDAKDLFDRVALSHKALREATGFTDDDAPSDDERAERIGILTRDSSLAWDGIPSVKAGGIEPQPGVIVTGQGGGATVGAPSGAPTGGEAEKGPPPEGPSGGNAGDDPAAGLTGSVPPSPLTIGRILMAADMGLLRARDAAGSKIWSLLNQHRDVREEMKDVRKGDLAAALGRERLRELRITDRDLCTGSRILVIDALRLFTKLDRETSNLIADAVEQHALRTLYDSPPKPLPDTFAVYMLSRRNGH